ncbi:Solute carrier family 25 member 38 [Toxocara canis]|uniref:Solute carrier family 25 member 38 n=1 Tax=Toxocara canis TaxID=6265 RepID=A0A0B2VCV8_TOXCA|nr:Solute carrier family 25 member 38 [Toxocara canis]
MGGVSASKKSKVAVAAVLSSVAFGSISGFVSSVLLQPLDRLKTLSQQDAVRRMNVFQRTALVVRDHGVLDLWRGIVPTLLRVVPGVAVYFGCLEIGRTFVPKESNENAANFLLGAVSRSVAAALLMPATVIKTRFESSFYRDASVLSAAKNVIEQNGVREGRVHAPATRFSSGVLAGVLACAVTQPFDITKTQIQLYPQKYRSLFHVAHHLYLRGGLTAFFNGFWLRATRRTFISAMNWTIFDEVLRRLSYF